MARLIFHIDVNSAFLSWEATRRVSLGEEDIRLLPSAIGGDRDKRTGVILADVHECPGGFLIKTEIRSCQEQIRALAQRHGHRFAGLYTEFLGRNGLSQDDAGTLVPISANC